MRNSQLAKALLILRLTIVFFMVPWVIDKFTVSGVEHTAKIFERFYKISGITEAASYGIGVFWALLLLAFLLGFKKRISYGLVMLFHGIGTIMTWDVLLPWMENHNMLFLAAVPTLGAMIALYILRDYDTIWALDKS